MSMIILADEDQANNTVEADRICKTLGKALIKAYPKRKWYVDVNWVGKVAWICCPDISMQYGYALHLDKLTIEAEKAAVMAGGTILEMFNLKRERNAMGGEELIKRDIRGNAIQQATGL